MSRPRVTPLRRVTSLPGVPHVPGVRHLHVNRPLGLVDLIVMNGQGWDEEKKFSSHKYFMQPGFETFHNRITSTVKKKKNSSTCKAEQKRLLSNQSLLSLFSGHTQ